MQPLLICRQVARAGSMPPPSEPNLLHRACTKACPRHWGRGYHQDEIIQAGAQKLGLSMEKVVVTIDRYGYSSSASIPIALDEVYRGGALKNGDKVLMVSFGAGMTSAAIILEWWK